MEGALGSIGEAVRAVLAGSVLPISRLWGLRQVLLILWGTRARRESEIRH